MNESFVWCDMEMSGLDPEKNTILEIALLVTGDDLRPLDEGLCLAVHQPESVLEAMDDWNREHHTRSGLVGRVRVSEFPIAAAQRAALEYVGRHCRSGKSPLCGNSIWQDRRFLIRYLPELNGFFHYRNVDVSTIKELVRRWYPQLPPFEKKKAHEALSDIRESIEELKYYRARVFVPGDAAQPE